MPTSQFIARQQRRRRGRSSTRTARCELNGPIADAGAGVGHRRDRAGRVQQTAGRPARVRPASQKSLPIDAGGGDPAEQLPVRQPRGLQPQPNTQVYVRYAWQDRATRPGTNASSPYDGYDTGSSANNHNILGSFTHVYSPTFTMQTKVVWNRLDERPAAQRRPAAHALHEPDDARSGCRATASRSPATCRGARAARSRSAARSNCCSSTRTRRGSRAGTTSASAGCTCASADDRTFGAYANSVESLNTTSAALPSLDNFVLGQTRAVPDRDRPERVPGRHLHDAGVAARASTARTATTSSRSTSTTTGPWATASR